MTAKPTQQGLSWFGIVRLGLVQTALGAIVVLTTSTINRVMIVELALPALVPGLLVTWHYALQGLRPRWGHGSDLGKRRTPWIIGGMGILALGGIGAALSIMMLSISTLLGLATAAIAFTLIGIGVGASGTSLLILLATSVDKNRRPAAATIVWVMMIAGFVVTSAIGGKFLDPFSPERLMVFASITCGVAFIVVILATFRLERSTDRHVLPEEKCKVPFREAFQEVWQDPTARRFAIFIFISMLAYSAQDLILEPFAGLIFFMTPGETTALSGTQNSGVLAGMILVGAVATIWSRSRIMALRNWTFLGCLGSAFALIGLVAAAKFAPAYPLKLNVFLLGFCNGMFAVAAIGSMFNLAHAGGDEREGLRMGLFGAAQAVAFGMGGLSGTALADFARLFLGSPVTAYASVFAVESVLFVIAAFIALTVGRQDSRGINPLMLAAGHTIGTN